MQETEEEGLMYREQEDVSSPTQEKPVQKTIQQTQTKKQEYPYLQGWHTDAGKQHRINELNLILLDSKREATDFDRNPIYRKLEAQAEKLERELYGVAQHQETTSTLEENIALKPTRLKESTIERYANLLENEKQRAENEKQGADNFLKSRGNQSIEKFNMYPELYRELWFSWHPYLYKIPFNKKKFEKNCEKIITLAEQYQGPIEIESLQLPDILHNGAKLIIGMQHIIGREDRGSRITYEIRYGNSLSFHGWNLGKQLFRAFVQEFHKPGLTYKLDNSR